MAAIKVRVVRAPVYATNTIIVSGPSAAVVIDPGAGVVDDVIELLEGDDLTAVAILLTHGHVDHTWGAAELSERLDIPVLVDPEDAYRLSDPFGLDGAAPTHDATGPLGDALREAGFDPASFRGPTNVQFLGSSEAGATMARVEDEVGGHWAWIAGPGHTEGSTVYVMEHLDDEGTPKQIALTGDILFSGGVGRTDLPGSDADLMVTTLGRIGVEIPGTALIIPGHGPGSTLAIERKRNPLLRSKG